MSTHKGKDEKAAGSDTLTASVSRSFGGSIDSAKAILGFSKFTNTSYLRFRERIRVILANHNVSGISDAGSKQTEEILNEIRDHKDNQRYQATLSSGDGRAALKHLVADIAKKARTQFKKAMQEESLTPSSHNPASDTADPRSSAVKRGADDLDSLPKDSFDTPSDFESKCRKTASGRLTGPAVSLLPFSFIPRNIQIYYYDPLALEGWNSSDNPWIARKATRFLTVLHRPTMSAVYAMLNHYLGALDVYPRAIYGLDKAPIDGHGIDMGVCKYRLLNDDSVAAWTGFSSHPEYLHLLVRIANQEGEDTFVAQHLPGDLPFMTREEWEARDWKPSEDFIEESSDEEAVRRRDTRQAKRVKTKSSKALYNSIQKTRTRIAWQQRLKNELKAHHKKIDLDAMHSDEEGFEDATDRQSAKLIRANAQLAQEAATEAARKEQDRRGKQAELTKIASSSSSRAGKTQPMSNTGSATNKQGDKINDEAKRSSRSRRNIEDPLKANPKPAKRSVEDEVRDAINAAKKDYEKTIKFYEKSIKDIEDYLVQLPLTPTTDLTAFREKDEELQRAKTVFESYCGDNPILAN